MSVEHSLREDRSKAQNISAKTNTHVYIPLEDVRLCRTQPRRYFDGVAMQELVDSVRRHGILQPLLVRPVAVECYELVAGERRYRAAEQVGLQVVPAIVREMDEEEAVQYALIENIQRENLNPLEETEGILQLLAIRLKRTEAQIVSLLYRLQNSLRKKATHNVMGSSELEAVQSVFTSIGTMTCESFINNRLPLRNIPHDIFTALREGRLAYTKARVLAQIKDRVQRGVLLEETIARNLTLSQLRSLIRTQNEPVNDAILKRIDAVYRRVKKERIWEDPDKKARFESLIAELDSLTDND